MNHIGKVAVDCRVTISRTCVIDTEQGSVSQTGSSTQHRIFDAATTRKAKFAMEWYKYQLSAINNEGGVEKN